MRDIYIFVTMRMIKESSFLSLYYFYLFQYSHLFSSLDELKRRRFLKIGSTIDLARQLIIVTPILDKRKSIHYVTVNFQLSRYPLSLSEAGVAAVPECDTVNWFSSRGSWMKFLAGAGIRHGRVPIALMLIRGGQVSCVQLVKKKREKKKERKKRREGATLSGLRNRQFQESEGSE